MSQKQHSFLVNSGLWPVLFVFGERIDVHITGRCPTRLHYTDLILQIFYVCLAGYAFVLLYAVNDWKIWMLWYLEDLAITFVCIRLFLLWTTFRTVVVSFYHDGLIAIQKPFFRTHNLTAPAGFKVEPHRFCRRQGSYFHNAYQLTCHSLAGSVLVCDLLDSADAGLAEARLNSVGKLIREIEKENQDLESY